MNLLYKENFYRVLTAGLILIFVIVIALTIIYLRNLADSSLDLDQKSITAVASRFDLASFEKIRSRFGQ